MIIDYCYLYVSHIMMLFFFITSLYNYIVVNKQKIILEHKLYNKIYMYTFL